ncbi:conserved hypothetical protein [Leishmania major strain Friedlin]|uniref:C3H1-type domain-containing protein n=1 Tax=Leishmania major TaxID=5664 RepID=Q4Q3B8_LEIMA|nr:conserved hypothetical protein [Leishmania major strain Friedlin]CAJ07794.1 conserved hypothetical protein [Leishmania major strain Friedlin]|eukprot:XP_001686180.1 conserved hypothetical protein [Leishmania major strain Friedlin]
MHRIIIIFHGSAVQLQRMPKEPQPSRPYVVPLSAPYAKPSGSLVPTASSSTAATAVARAAAANAAGGGAAPAAGGHRLARLTINNFSSFRARVKKLPPDANVKAALHTQLFQFPERVCFGCVKCRRDNVESDSVAIDLKNRIMLCAACFTRIIRPRTYTPSRVVPFPSLLSWLNYKPSHVMEMPDDVLERPAEAVAPSGERMATPMLAGGDRATNLGKLPAIAMNIAAGDRSRGGDAAGGRRGGPTIDEALAQGSASTPAGTHPCLRVWGVCQHGETCLFRNAPADLCVAYLMGLCRGRSSPIGGAPVGGGGGGGRPNANRNNNRHGHGGQHQQHHKHSYYHSQGGRNARRDRGAITAGGVQTCRLLHQDVYDLPDVSDPPPRERFEGDLEDKDGAWAAWVCRRRDSPNSAEWQLWHNGPLEQLFRAYVPARRRPVLRQPKKKLEVAPAAEASTAVAELAEEEGERNEGEEGAQTAEDELTTPLADEEDVMNDEEDGEEEGDGDADANDDTVSEGVAGKEAEDEPAPAPVPAPTTKLNLIDIMAALKGIKKDPPEKADDAEK